MPRPHEAKVAEAQTSAHGEEQHRGADQQLEAQRTDDARSVGVLVAADANVDPEAYGDDDEPADDQRQAADDVTALPDTRLECVR